MKNAKTILRGDLDNSIHCSLKNMLRKKFQIQIDKLNNALIEMGNMAANAIALCAQALTKQDKDLCNEVITLERELDSQKAYIENKTIKLLLMQQPVAKDLRLITTATKMAADLERIGDQARDVCEIVLSLCDETYQVDLKILPQMGEIIMVMTSSCIKAFIDKDIDKAKEVIALDDKVDELFDTLKSKMIKSLKSQPKYADQMIYFLMIGKHFEKIGDYVENVAKRIVVAI